MQLRRKVLPILSLGICVSMGTQVMAQSQESRDDISLSQVMVAPDNHDLVLKYAQQQVDKGNFQAAANATEILLFANPNWDSARVLYAYILVQLDDIPAADREIRILEPRQLTSNNRAMLNKIIYALDSTASEQTDNEPTFAGFLEAGVGLDSNAGNLLTDSVNIQSSADDLSLFLNAALLASVPIDGLADLKGSVSYRLKRYDEFEQANFDALSGRLGLAKDINGFTPYLGLYGDRVALDGETYLEETGIQARLSHQINDTLTLRLNAQGGYQDYKALPNAGNEVFRSGQKYRGGVGFSYKPSDKFNSSFGVNIEQKDAQTESLQYGGWQLYASAQQVLDKGHYVAGRLSYRDLDYNAPTLINGVADTRNDNHLYGRLAFGTKMTNLVGPSEAFENVSLELGVHHINRNSNFSAFDFDNTGTDLRLKWRF